MTSIVVRQIFVRAEQLEIAGKLYVSQLKEPRAIWAVLIEDTDDGSVIDIAGTAESQEAAIAAAERLTLQLQEFVAGNDSAAVLQ